MLFTPLDAAALIAFVALLTGAVTWVCARLKLDVIAWGALTAGSLPPTLYFSVKEGLDMATITGWLIAVGSTWAVLLFLIWVRLKAMDLLIPSRLPRRASNRPIGATAGPAEVDSTARSSVADGTPLNDPAEGSAAIGLAYFLMGIGGSTAAAAAAVLFFLFAPNRHGPPLVPLRLDQPAFQICAAGLFAGLALFGAGRWWVARRSCRRDTAARGRF